MKINDSGHTFCRLTPVVGGKDVRPASYKSLGIATLKHDYTRNKNRYRPRSEVNY